MTTIIPTTGLTAWVAEATANWPTVQQVELHAYPVVAAMVTAAGDEAGHGGVLIVTPGGVVRPVRDEVDTGDTVLIQVSAEPLAEGWEPLAVGRLRHQTANILFEELREARAQSDIDDAWGDILKYGLDNDYARQLRARAENRIQAAG